MVGVWDPLLPTHEQLLEQLRSHARRESLLSSAIVLDPDPVRFLWGVSELPVYNDIKTRIRLLLRCGLDSVVQVRFRRNDLTADAADLFGAVSRVVAIKELWLGARQTLGRGDGNSFEGIVRMADELGMRVKRLPHTRLATEDVRELLAAGCVKKATTLAGRPPIRSRPKSGRLRLAWRPGLYKAVPIEDVDGDVRGEPIPLRLLSDRGLLPKLVWPDRSIRFLAFVTGPDD